MEKPVVLARSQAGKDNRQVGATLMNQDSSRSHSIFTITIECIEKLESTAAPKPGARSACAARPLPNE